MSETITSDTDNEIPMNALPVRNSQSADNNSLNDSTSSDETTAMIASTSSPTPAATPPLLTGNGQRNNGPEIVAYRRIFAAIRRLITGWTQSAPLTQAPSELPRSATPFSDWDKFMARYCIVIYLWDVVSDFYLVGKHLINHDWWYFGLTLLFVLLPSFVMTFIMRRWYDQWQCDGRPVQFMYPAPNIYIRHLKTWAQLGPFYRYKEILDHGLQSRDTARSSEERCEHLTILYYKQLEMSRLRLIDTFVESGPQLIILAKTSTELPDILTIGSVLGSLAALSSALVNYELAPYMGMVRFVSPTAQRNYNNIKIEGSIVNFIWRLLTIMARVLAMALFASVFPVYMGLACCGHWLIMFIWVIWITLNLEHLIINTNIVRNPNTRLTEFTRKNYTSAACLAYVLIFCYHDSCGKLTGQQVIYYPIVVIENCALIGFWYAYCPTGLWYTWLALYAHFGCFILGLIIMGVYYICLYRRAVNVGQVINAPEPWWYIYAHVEVIKRLLGWATPRQPEQVTAE